MKMWNLIVSKKKYISVPELDRKICPSQSLFVLVMPNGDPAVDFSILPLHS